MPKGVYIRIKENIRSPWNKGKRLGFVPRGAFKRGHISWMTGKKHSEETRSKISRSLMGRKIPEDVVRKIIQTKKENGYKHSEETKRKIGDGHRGKKMSSEAKEKMSIAKKGKKTWNFRKHHPNVSGEKCHFLRGGITPLNKKLRTSMEYKSWRESVFKRDDYTCQECHERGGKLNADHIKPFAYFPDLRFAINNGQTLCIDCHRKTKTYAGRVKSIYNFKKA